MRTGIITLGLLFYSFIARCQQNYDASLIPQELMAHASAVIRSQDMNVEVEDWDNTIVHIKTAVTILNKNSDDQAHIEIEHDKSRTIKYVKGAIYNEFGKQTGKFSESDFEDSNPGDGFSLFNDGRVKHYFPSITQYPYTIVYEYELRLKETLNFEPWIPVDDYGVSAEKSSFTFSCKPDFAIRYKEENLPEKANMGSDKKGLKVYSWHIYNVKAAKYEPKSPYRKRLFASVMIAPQTFEYYGIKGSFSNWNELGKWVYDKLVANRQELPAETAEHVKELTKDITDPKLKAKKIFEYMQNKTHYVSVQVGIGGLQPFLAADVDKQNYGDCKALVSYTQALLKAVYIDSYYCIVQSGRDYKVNLLNDFASIGQGNHIILCLPFKNDTTWVDCTSQTIPFGYLGDFTDDRDVLACTPSGGKLLHTPKYTYQNNMESRKANFIINEGGQLSGTMSTIFKGTDYDDREEFISEPKTEQLKMLQHTYPLNNLEIESLEFKQDKSPDPVTTENIKLHARDYASLTGGKYYFMLNPANRNSFVPKQVMNRKNSVYINRGYTEEDAINYTLPAGYKLEKTPLDLTIDKPFGKFTASMQLQGNQLIYKRKLQLIDGTYDKDLYQELVDFYQSVADADDYTVSLVK